MGNPENQFQQGYTTEQFMALWGITLQFKKDKKGGNVTGDANNLLSGASRANLVDDLLLAVADGSIGGGVINSGRYDNRATPISLLEVSGVQTGFVDITTPFNSGHVELIAYHQNDVEESAFATGVSFWSGVPFGPTSTLLAGSSDEPYEANSPQGFLLHASQTLHDGNAGIPETAPSSGIRRLHWLFNSPSVALSGSPKFAFVIKLYNIPDSNFFPPPV